MAPSPIRVLVVDDFEPFRRFVCSTLQNNLNVSTISEASDGLEAIELAQALQPHLIVLDIGIPKLNGIEAARQFLIASMMTVNGTSGSRHSGSRE